MCFSYKWANTLVPPTPFYGERPVPVAIGINRWCFLLPAGVGVPKRGLEGLEGFTPGKGRLQRQEKAIGIAWCLCLRGWHAIVAVASNERPKFIPPVVPGAAPALPKAGVGGFSHSRVWFCKDETWYKNLAKFGPIVKSHLRVTVRNSCYRIKGPDQNLHKIRAHYRITGCIRVPNCRILFSK